jgi:hypothetical protein
MKGGAHKLQQGWSPSEEALIQQVMDNHGYSREEAIDRLIAFGGL